MKEVADANDDYRKMHENMPWTHIQLIVAIRTARALEEIARRLAVLQKQNDKKEG